MPAEAAVDAQRQHWLLIFCQRYEKYSLISAFCLIANKIRVPTGALMSTVSFNEGASVPGIAHAIMIEHC